MSYVPSLLHTIVACHSCMPIFFGFKMTPFQVFQRAVLDPESLPHLTFQSEYLKRREHPFVIHALEATGAQYADWIQFAMMNWEKLKHSLCQRYGTNAEQFSLLHMMQVDKRTPNEVNDLLGAITGLSLTFDVTTIDVLTQHWAKYCAVARMYNKSKLEKTDRFMQFMSFNIQPLDGRVVSFFMHAIDHPASLPTLAFKAKYFKRSEHPFVLQLLEAASTAIQMEVTYYDWIHFLLTEAPLTKVCEAMEMDTKGSSINQLVRILGSDSHCFHDIDNALSAITALPPLPPSSSANVKVKLLDSPQLNALKRRLSVLLDGWQSFVTIHTLKWNSELETAKVGTSKAETASPDDDVKTPYDDAPLVSFWQQTLTSLCRVNPTTICVEPSAFKKEFDSWQEQQQKSNGLFKPLHLIPMRFALRSSRVLQDWFGFIEKFRVEHYRLKFKIPVSIVQSVLEELGTDDCHGDVIPGVISNAVSNVMQCQEPKSTVAASPSMESPSDPCERRKKIPKRIRDMVWETYIGSNLSAHRCFCCKKEMIWNTNFHCGHIVPASRGGKASVENLRPICARCNLSMSDQDMKSFIVEHELFF